MGLGFKDVDFFGQVCLPDDRRKVNLRSMFDVCVSVPCVAPKSTIELNEKCRRNMNLQLIYLHHF